MKTILFKLTLVVVAFLTGLLLTACNGEKQEDKQVALFQTPFPVDTAVNALQVIEVWYTDAQAIDSVASERQPITTATLKGQLVLRARDGKEVIQITKWNSEKAAQDYANGLTQNQFYKIRVSRVVNYGAKDPKLFLIDSSSSIQYSEYLMKRKTAIDSLSIIAKGMTTSMAQVQPTLDFIVTMNSVDSSTISLLGIWNTKEGFEVFAKEKTWGDKPYWEPYAENDHHMFNVVLARSK